MAKYVCSVCGYVHDEEKNGLFSSLAQDWKCPICKAGKDAFKLADGVKQEKELEKPHLDKELSPLEMSVICSNLARGCEKQYNDEQAKAFRELADFFKSKAQPEESASVKDILELLEKDLSVNFPYGKNVAGEKPDRGALRCQVWGEKGSQMLRSLVSRYLEEGDKMLENTNVYVCSICGYIYLGDNAPELCPVCKVPAWKFDKIEGRD